jgi:hypothetical protein
LRGQIPQVQAFEDRERQALEERYQHQLQMAHSDHQAMVGELETMHQHVQQQLAEAVNENSMLLTRLGAAEEVAESKARELSQTESTLKQLLDQEQVKLQSLCMYVLGVC